MTSLSAVRLAHSILRQLLEEWQVSATNTANPFTKRTVTRMDSEHSAACSGAGGAITSPRLKPGASPLPNPPFSVSDWIVFESNFGFRVMRRDAPEYLRSLCSVWHSGAIVSASSPQEALAKYLNAIERGNNEI